VSRSAAAVALAISLCSGCGLLGTGDGPGDAKSFTYDAELGQVGKNAEADVSYTSADGQTVTEHVTMPWKSEPIPVRKGRGYHIDVHANVAPGAYLNCGMHLDTGWNIGAALSSDDCSYWYP